MFVYFIYTESWGSFEEMCAEKKLREDVIYKLNKQLASTPGT